MSNDSVTLTREELYQRVWSTPTRTLAAEFGISDVALAKICRKFDIPKPPLGHWRRKETGYKTRTPPLPPWRKPDRGLIVIHRTVRSSLSLRPEVQMLVDAERDKVRPIIVEAGKTHPIVRAARKVRKEAGVDDFGRLHFPSNSEVAGLSVTKHSLDRALHILNALLLAAEDRGFKVEIQREYKITLAIVVGETAVKLKLFELVSKSEKLPPKKQGSYEYREWIYSPTGRLTLEIDDPLPDGMRRRWGDKEGDLLELRLNMVMGGIITAAEGLRLRHLEHEEWLRRLREDEERRRKESARRDAFEEVTKAWSRSQDLSAFLDASEALINADDKPAVDWMAWARNYVRRNDPFLNGHLDRMIQREFGQQSHEEEDS